MIKVYHNTECSKSNACLLFLMESGKPFEVVDYLINPPTESELREIIAKLNISPIELVRQKEPIWLEQLNGKNLTDDQIIAAMIAHPILIERPIVINGDKAVIARPTGKASEII